MSVNVKSPPRAAPSSGIPLPRSLLPSSPKGDSRLQTSSLPRPSTHKSKQLTPTQTPTHSPKLSARNTGIPGPSSKDLLRDATLRNKLLQQAALPVPQASRSAYSSPLTQRREPPRSRDTLDLGKVTHTSAHVATFLPSYTPPHTSTHTPQNSNQNRYTCANRNQQWGDSNLSPQFLPRRRENYNTHTQEEGGSPGDRGDDEDPPEPVLVEDRSSRFSNDNLRPPPPLTLTPDPSFRGRSGSSSQSDEEMGTPEDLSPVVSPTQITPQPITLAQAPCQQRETPPTDTQTPRVNMATVAPFRYRLQVQERDVSVEELSDCSSGSIEVCCEDLTLGGMLGDNVAANVSMSAKTRELDSQSQEPPARQIMTSRKGPAKPSSLPQGPSRPSGPELRVYRPGTGPGPNNIPNPSKLRKQRSLTNLCVLTDAEKKLHLYQPPGWTDDMGRPGTGIPKTGQTKTGQIGVGGGGRAPLSRTLSKSEQSLFQGKPKPFSPPAVTPSLGKPSRIPRGPYAEVKPISKAPESGQSGDVDPSDHQAPHSKAKATANGKKTVEKGRVAVPSAEEKKEGKGTEGEEDKAFLKVDPELVVTVLGDLEQLLFSHMLDPESQRKRTVQNVLDLRQNLEDTMTSLRGAQLSHSCLDGGVCYDSDEAAAFSISSLSNRSSPLSWRQGQASPRLQAGDAPSTGHTQSHGPIRLSHTSRIQLIEGLDVTDPAHLKKGGYLSDSDLGGKSPTEDEDDDDDDDDDLVNGWDESSSISSGLSDGSDNLSSEEFNASPTLTSLPTTPIGSRRNSAIVMRTDAEKRSLVESGLSWDGDDTKPSRKSLGGGGLYDTGSLKTESASRWKKPRPQGEGLETGLRELKKPQTLSQSAVLKKGGRNPPVGVTSPITHTSQGALKVAALAKSDGKVVDKSRLAIRSSGLQRSCSDAGKEPRVGGAGEQRKPPSGLVRPATAGGNFGYKKPAPSLGNGTTGTATVTTTNGSSICGGSATVGKIPKSSGIPVKPSCGGSGGAGSRKTSLDVSGSEHSGFLSPSARNSVQYRSLPRPAKTSTLSLTKPTAGRPVSSSMDAGCGQLSVKPFSTMHSPASQGSRLKEPGSGLGGSGLGKAGGRGIPSPGPVNQTDREKEKERAKAKAVGSDSECGGGERASALKTPGEKLQGLRPPSSGKGAEPLSANTHRLSGVRTLGKPPSMVHLDKLSSSSLEVGMGIQDPLPPKIPPYSKLQDLVSSGGCTTTPCLTPSPAPLLNVNSSACFSGPGLGPRQGSALGVGGVAGSGSPLLYPRLSGLHRSMESLPLQMSLAPEPQDRERLAGGYPGTEQRDRDRQEERVPGTWKSGSRMSLTLSESSHKDRNTLPKKGLSYSSPSQSEEEGKERRHSHTILSLTDSLTPPLLPSPTSLPRSAKTSVVAPSPIICPPRMTRSNSIPTHDASLELYTSPLGSTLSLAERPRSMGMVRSGSFRDRDPNDEIHGSVLSLASNASSNYSSAEERIQGEQIRKLRRELESSQEKVANLTTQLSANANLVAAFEQSLALMTTRLQSLSVSQEQKDTELVDLRDTIEALQSKNHEAQAVIQGALNISDSAPKDLRMRRQNSCESISSLNSLTSLSSMGSLKDQDAKKKKKKSWLRSSFNKAFSIKKGPKTYSDIEEIATPDSSAPNSPKMPHEGGEAEESQTPSLKTSISATSSVILEGEEPESEERVVSELRSELWEKEMKLTDIRLEALNSAHQLEQLRDAMNSMQSTVENLKAENDQLKTGGPAPLPTSGPPMSTSQPSGLASLMGSSTRQPMSMSLTKSFSLSLNDCKDPELSPADTLSVSSLHDEVCVRVLVRISDQGPVSEEGQQQDFYLGSVRVGGRTDWASLDSLIAKTFRDYIYQVDPTASLGLTCDSLHSYQLTQGGRRVLGGDKPLSSPSRYLGNGPGRIVVSLKGLREKSVDSLVFETLVPKPMMQHYISLLLKHRRLILSGPSGTGKTYLTTRLARYLLQRSLPDTSDPDHEPSPPSPPSPLSHGAAVTFNMHRQSHKELQLYLSNMANQIDRESCGELPLVIILDDISDAVAVSELVNGALTCKYHKCPYIIGTTNQPVKMSPNHGLHLSFRMVTFSNNVEPANGFLLRYLHRKAVEAQTQQPPQDEGGQGPCAPAPALLAVLDWVPQLWYHLHTFLEKHSTSDFLIGPCFFLSCPVTVAEFRPWFIDLWNLSIIPYLQEGAKDGIKVHGQKAVWEDPVEWVRGTLPWPNAQQDQARLTHLPPPSSGPPSSEDRRAPKDTPPPCTLESDPLMAMLLKLQESANYIESPERESTFDSPGHSLSLAPR
ncbi:neuron navigator 1 isoform X1 [Osmerus eperlanus]|uniref:neuron navigator 1 isoform X1 n=1 Tax=Osmerus eperlanus TaxID=29151 RepID=UPI002E153BF4